MASEKLTLLQINDTYGYLEAHPELIWEGADARWETLGGYARIAGLQNSIRRECEGCVFVLDNGNTFHGT